MMPGSKTKEAPKDNLENLVLYCVSVYSPYLEQPWHCWFTREDLTPPQRKPKHSSTRKIWMCHFWAVFFFLFLYWPLTPIPLSLPHWTTRLSSINIWLSCSKHGYLLLWFWLFYSVLSGPDSSNTSWERSLHGLAKRIHPIPDVGVTIIFKLISLTQCIRPYWSSLLGLGLRLSVIVLWNCSVSLSGHTKTSHPTPPWPGCFAGNVTHCLLDTW